MDPQIISIVVTTIGIAVGVLGIIGIKILKRRKTWRDIANAFKVLEPKIRDINPDVIVGLADGRIIGALIAVNLRIPILYSIDIRKDQSGGIGPVLGEVGNIEGKKVLLVDNHIYTGANMRKAIEFLENKNPEKIVMLVLFQHRISFASVPVDYHAEEIKGDRMVWPWSLTQEKKDAYQEE